MSRCLFWATFSSSSSLSSNFGEIVGLANSLCLSSCVHTSKQLLQVILFVNLSPSNTPVWKCGSSQFLHIWQPYFCSDHIAGVSNGSLSLFGVLLLLFSLVFQFRWNVGLANFLGLSSCIHTPLNSRVRLSVLCLLLSNTPT